MEVEIQDNQERTLHCSDCHAPLMHYREYAKAGQLREKIRAKCPFCQGESFTVEVWPGFYTGPIGLDEKVQATVISEIDQDDKGVWIFSICRRK